MNDLPGAIQSYIDAYNRKDVAAMLECLSEDVTFCNISDGEVTTETCGKQAFAELADIGVQVFESRRQKIVNAISVAQTSLIEIEYSAVVATDLPNGWKSGEHLRFRGGSAFCMSAGKIVSIIDQFTIRDKAG